MFEVYTEISEIIFVVKTLFIGICIYFTSLKILKYNTSIKASLLPLGIILLESIMFQTIKNIVNYQIAIIILILTISILLSKITKYNIGNCIITTTISTSINYILFFIAIFLSFFPEIIFSINNDYISLTFIIIIHMILLTALFRTRKLKDGITYIKNKINNEYFDMLVLNISVSIVFIVSIYNSLYNINWEITLSLFFGLFIYSIITFIAIQKTLTMYYKHKMLIKDLNETKEKLEKIKKDRDRLERENIEISKKSHSISHKIKSLNKKIDKLMANNEVANELYIKEEAEHISKENYKQKALAELDKTGVEIIDDMLDCMKEECIENNIEFELKINGNIHHMVNNFVSKEELQILLADHIKDAIIAICHSNNINRSILVRLGIIEGIYSLYIYDTGIEFNINTLANLGSKPITTHEEDGGTGIGFLNTFDTLKRHNASLTINEIGKESKENYTKSIIIKFDGENKFKVKSYRLEEIRKINIEKYNGKINYEYDE